MTNTTMQPKRTVPEAFNEYRQKMFARTVRLTEQAIAKLEAEHHPLTLEGLCETTRELDELGKGLRPTAILRNPQAAALFHQHSPAYQARQHKARKAKRKHPRAKTASATPAIYLGLRTPDLIQMVEDLKAQVAGLNVQQEKFEAERKEAYRLRDEALQQNTRLLATLTSRAEWPGRKR